MCDCIKTTQEKTFDYINKQHPERTIVSDSQEGFQNTALTFGTTDKPGGIKMFIPFKYFYTFQKKDGSTSAVKSETVNMFFTFCPFCGKKY